jgi:competence protein ComEA
LLQEGDNLKNFNFKEKKIIYIGVCILIVIICIIICVVVDNNNKNNDYTYLDIEVNNVENNVEKNVEGTEEKSKEKSEEDANYIYVHITGEVVNTGVITAKEGDRIKDIVEKAGGFTSEADIEKVNLAYEVSDGQKITIPSINENNDNKTSADYITEDSGENVVEESTKTNSKININTATQSELESLNGIGPSIASKIIKYRESNGKFKSIEEIKNVSGIGDEKYKNIENDITVK